MSSMELTNLSIIMSSAISFVISFIFALSKLILLKAFIEYKNIISGTLNLAIDSYIIIENATII